jgi:nitrite reductase (NO-forming)
MTDKHDTSKVAAQETTAINRRSLLVGSVGATVGGVVAAQAAFAQSATQVAQADHSHSSHSGSLGSRLYSVNPSDASVADIAENPVNIPPPIERQEPATVRVDLETIEVEAFLDANTRYRFWTFNGKVPGPFVRVRVGDTVEVHLKNHEDSWMFHNVDFHAATGPGGGAAATTAAPGEERSFTFSSSRSRACRRSIASST